METTIEPTIDPNLECAICSDVFYKPVSLNCGHTFCKECVINMIASKPQCALCKTPCFLQEKNLKENVTLKNHIENTYPDQIRRRQNLSQNKVTIEEVKTDTHQPQEPVEEKFNPLVILPLNETSNKILFPGTEEVLSIRITFDPDIVKNVCNDKRFLAIPYSTVQERTECKTCVLEFVDIRPDQKARDLYKARVRVCERVLVKEYTHMDLDHEALEKMGFPGYERTVTLQVGKGNLLRDHNVATLQQIEDQVGYIEEFLNEKLNHWAQSSRENAQFVIDQMQHVMMQGQNRNMDYFVNFSFTLAKILKSSREDKLRMFETTNTLERLLVLRHIVDAVREQQEISAIFEFDIPGHKIFNNPIIAVLVLIALLVFLYLQKSKNAYY